MPRIRVVVADDHPMFRDGIANLLRESDSTELVADVDSGDAAVEAVASLSPDVVVMDLRMPGLSGIDATRRIVRDRPDTGVLVLTMMDDDTSVLAAMRAGARGYVLKGARAAEILRAIEMVAAGEAVFGAPLAARMMQLFAIPGTRASERPFPELTAREHEILELLSTGLDNAAIASQLGLSDKTVRNNVSAIFTKLRVSDRAAAVVRARNAGIGQSSTSDAAGQ